MCLMHWYQRVCVIHARMGVPRNFQKIAEGQRPTVVYHDLLRAPLSGCFLLHLQQWRTNILRRKSHIEIAMRLPWFSVTYLFI